ncbi:hypothetical protein BRC81_13225 [Halobacteriales archaeon QS_1_68_20]|nr:MAG: hypothetical protein BRC81_13225 [Halobacteriales archaeon QS_1_68_20]
MRRPSRRSRRCTSPWSGEVLPFDEGAAREATRIRDELRPDGSMIPTPDVMIAGVVRATGGTLVTRDRDVIAVDDLDVLLLDE